MVSQAELELKRIGTREFVNADATTIALSRDTTVSDGAGGWVKSGDGVLLPDQQFAVIGNNNQLPINTSVDGDNTTPQFTLIGRWDADIAKGDRFTLNGLVYSVDFVYPDRSYETRAEVTLHG